MIVINIIIDAFPNLSKWCQKVLVEYLLVLTSRSYRIGNRVTARCLLVIVKELPDADETLADGHEDVLTD